jgi:hypothetical protein
VFERFFFFLSLSFVRLGAFLGIFNLALYVCGDVSLPPELGDERTISKTKVFWGY